MATWKDILSRASRAGIVERSRTGLGNRVEYVLGRGGFDPAKPLGAKSDCSGFVAWAIGMPRELPPGSGNWLDTTAYWNGRPMTSAGRGWSLFDQIGNAAAIPGDLLVYPDAGGREGHMGVVSAVDDTGPTRVIHCSLGNWRNHGDAVQETDVSVFMSHPKIRVMRVDFDAIWDFAGISLPTDVAVPRGLLKHALLAASPTLLKVATGSLVIERTDERVAGIDVIHDAFMILDDEDAGFHIDLGRNMAHRGIFGSQTRRAMLHLQEVAGLPKTGDLDRETLLALDEKLMDARDGDHDEIAEARTAEDGVLDPSVDSLGDEGGFNFDLIREDRKWFARVNAADQRLFVGRPVKYLSHFGLQNIAVRDVPLYEADHYRERFQHWADVIVPTAEGESHQSFVCVNSYDRAQFTFGFFQFAAHTPEENFVILLRRLLALPEAHLYFPDLELANGRVMQRLPNGLTPLEDAENRALRQYFNPSLSEVERVEVLNAARLVHWATVSSPHRDLQVELAIERMMTLLRRAVTKGVPIDGRVDSLCVVVADVLHQGRGTYAKLRAAFEANNDAVILERLLALGSASYPERVKTVRDEIHRLTESHRLGLHRYRADRNHFEPL